MKEDRREKKRGLPNSRLLTAAIITALFLGSGNALAKQNVSSNSYEVTEQMQTQTVKVTVVDSHYKNQVSTPEERERSLNDMIKLALESVDKRQ